MANCPDKPVKCMCVPGLPVPCSNEGKFHLDERDKFMFNLVAQEHPSATATDVEYYPLNKVKSKADALYGEMITHGWDGPFKLRGIISEVQPGPEQRDVGYRSVRTPKIWIARAEVESVGMREPRLGDVLRVWKLPYWARVATKTPPNTIDGFFFNVQLVSESGVLFDTSTFVGFDCGLVRNTEFTPERRVYDK